MYAPTTKEKFLNLSGRLEAVVWGCELSICLLLLHAIQGLYVCELLMIPHLPTISVLL